MLVMELLLELVLSSLKMSLHMPLLVVFLLKSFDTDLIQRQLKNC